MADVRTHVVGATTYELIGLGARAEEIGSAAAVVEAMVEARVAAVRLALDGWRGAHATTFATGAGVVLGASVSLAAALRSRAAHLARFPATAATSWAQVRRLDASYAAASAAAIAAPAAAAGVTAADPAALRRFVESSVGLGAQTPALAGRVHLRGVTGRATTSRPLDAAERAASLAAGTGPAAVDAATVAVARTLDAGEIAALVGLVGVEAEAARLARASDGVEAFTAAVAAAYEAADAGLLTVLADLGRAADLGVATADAVTGALVDGGDDEAELERAVAVLGDIASLAPAAVAASFQGHELTVAVARLDALQASGADDVQGRFVAPLAAALASAMAAADPLTRDRFVDEAGAHALAMVLTSARFDAGTVDRGFDRLWAANPTSIAPLAARYGGDLRQGALAALATQPDLAGAKLAGDPALTEQVLRSWYSDGGAAASALLMSVFHDRVLRDLAADAADTVSLLESQAVLLHAIGARVELLDPIRAAMASVAGLHLDEIASVAEYGAATGALGGIERGALVDFYAELFASAEAQRRAAAGLGVFASATFEAAAIHAEAQPPWDRSFGVASADVGHISRLFEDAIAEGNDDLAGAASMWAVLADAAVGAGIDLGLPALGVPGGWATALGAGGGLLVGAIASALPDPTLPEVRATHRSVARQALAAAVLADHPALLSEPLGAADLARLRDDDYLQAVAGGDAEAVREFLAIVDAPANASFKADILEVLQGAAIADRIDTPR